MFSFAKQMIYLCANLESLNASSGFEPVFVLSIADWAILPALDIV